MNMALMRQIVIATSDWLRVLGALDGPASELLEHPAVADVLNEVHACSPVATPSCSYILQLLCITQLRLLRMLLLLLLLCTFVLLLGSSTPSSASTWQLNLERLTRFDGGSSLPTVANAVSVSRPRCSTNAHLPPWPFKQQRSKPHQWIGICVDIISTSWVGPCFL